MIKSANINKIIIKNRETVAKLDTKTKEKDKQTITVIIIKAVTMTVTKTNIKIKKIINFKFKKNIRLLAVI